MLAFVAIAALLSCSMAQPWYAAGYCRDTHDLCTTRNWVEDCGINPSVQRQCPATCGLCTQAGYYGLGSYAAYAPAYYYPTVYDTCQDTMEGCADLAAAGWCNYEQQHKTVGLVSTQCRRSCGTCGIYKKK